jgi:pyruvate formate lyase activating enzyme
MLEAVKKPYWLRYVLVPKLNDSKKDLQALKEILAGLSCYEKFEFLPYHTLGRHKWKYMKLKYPLGDTRAATCKDIERALSLIK